MSDSGGAATSESSEQPTDQPGCDHGQQAGGDSRQDAGHTSTAAPLEPSPEVVHRFRVVPASYLVLRRGDQVLLQLRRGTGYMDGYWACGSAGHVERGESAQACVSREAREELGIEVDPADLTPLCALHRTGTGRAVDERVDFFFSARAWSGEPRIAEPDKSAALRWFDLDTLPDPVVPHELVVLRGLANNVLPAVLSVGFERDADV